MTPARPLEFSAGLDLAGARAITRLVTATGFFNDEEIGIARELADETLARGSAAGYRFLFARDGAQVVGYSCYGHIPGTRDSWDLYWIVVDPACQGRGIGRRLLEATEGLVRDAGGQSLWIETSSRAQYAGTRAFYASSDYRQVAVLENFYGPGDSKCIYRRLLQ